MHVALIGDSILDNRAYTGSEPDVVAHLTSVLKNAVEVTLCAIDGSTTSDLAAQVSNVPPSATHIVVSIGGNDALLNSYLLTMPVRSTAKALTVFKERIDQFEAAYRKAINRVLALNRQTAICTIYNGNLDPPQADLARIALMMFNDVSLRCGFEWHLPVIDLRFVCSEKSDYANPIEPSGSGGLKIARAVAGWLEIGQLRHTSKVHTN